MEMEPVRHPLTFRENPIVFPSSEIRRTILLYEVLVNAFATVMLMTIILGVSRAAVRVMTRWYRESLQIQRPDQFQQRPQLQLLPRSQQLPIQVLGEIHPDIEALRSLQARWREVAVTQAVLLEQFECPVCYEYSHPPISQCKNGHVICVTCCQRLLICPVCKVDAILTRNLAMDHLAKFCKFPCRYAHSNSCAEKCYLKDLADHEDGCRTQKYPCLIQERNDRCAWTGGLGEVKHHLLAHHMNKLTIMETGNNTGALVFHNPVNFLLNAANSDGPTHFYVLLNCYDETFLMYLRCGRMRNLRRRERQFYNFDGHVRIIANHKKASEFRVAIIVDEKEMFVRGPGEPCNAKGKPRKDRKISSSAYQFRRSEMELSSPSGKLTIAVKVTQRESLLHLNGQPDRLEE